MSNFKAKKLVALYTDIGRGHPNYMDSTLRAIKARLGELPADFMITSVFRESTGLSLLAWKTIRKIYRAGAQGGIVSSLYNAVRTKETPPSQDNRALKILGRDLRRAFDGFDGILLVAHPMLVQILGDICHVYYIHGEIAAPMEFIPAHAEKIYLPLAETAEKMISRGVPSERIEITGLMLEPELVPDAARIIMKRLSRIETVQIPTFGFFTSGAYPKKHVKQIIEGINHILKHKIGHVILSAGNDSRMFLRFIKKLNHYKPLTETDLFMQNKHDLLILHDPEREKLTLKELEMLPYLDILVMAAHERVNWSLAFNMPTILLQPNIGSFSGMNFEFTAGHAPIFHHPYGNITTCIEGFLQKYREKDKMLFEQTRKFDIHGSGYVADSILKALSLE